MRIGEEIFHPAFGRGIVAEIGARGGHLGAVVDFGYMKSWVTAAESGQDSAADASVPAPDPPSSALHGMPDAVVEARRGVLALRLGQILESDVRELSAGTESIEAEMEALVSRATNGRAGFLLVEGAWGSGKTHLLTMLNAIAASKGMASCSVILDGAGLRLSDPAKLMAALLASLKYPGEPAPQGIRERLALHRQARRRARLTLVEQAVRALPEAPRSVLDDAEALEVLEDYFCLASSATAAKDKLMILGYGRVNLPSMAARTVDDRPARFYQLLRSWTEFVVTTGAKGLVLTFDELDVEYASTKGEFKARRKEKERRAALLSALARSVGRAASSKAPRLPLVVAFGSAPGSGEGASEDDPVRDLKKHLDPAGLKLVSAPRPDLPQLLALGRRVTELYARAYPNWTARVSRNEMEKRLDELAREHLDGLSPVTRNFVRRALELLDVAPDLCGRQAEA